MATVGIVAIGLVWLVLGVVGSLLLARDLQRQFEHIATEDVGWLALSSLAGPAALAAGLIVTVASVLSNKEWIR